MNIDQDFFIRDDLTGTEHGRHSNFSSTKLEKTLDEDLRRTSKTVSRFRNIASFMYNFLQRIRDWIRVVPTHVLNLNCLFEGACA